MKYFLCVLMVSSMALAESEFYYYTSQSWAGMYKPSEVPKDIGASCKALIDPATKKPYDKKLMKMKLIGNDLSCDSNGFAQMKTGKDLDQAKAAIITEKAAEDARVKAIQDSAATISALKALVCKDHPTEAICK